MKNILDLLFIFGLSIAFSAPEISLEGDTKAASILLQEISEKKGSKKTPHYDNLSHECSKLGEQFKKIKLKEPVHETLVKPWTDQPPCSTFFNNGGNLENSCTQSQLKDQPFCNLGKNHAANSELIVFVSFSLGDATLKRLFQDVSKVGGRLVLRGLYKNSFRLTQQRIKDLEIVVDIDPPLFEKFQIQEVPTFILALSSQGETVPDHDVLKGNVSLSYALEQFVKEGSIKDSELLLKKLKGDGGA